MSEWYEADTDDIDVDKGAEQVNIWVKQNDFGSVYVILTFEQIEEIHNKIKTRNMGTN